MHNKLHVHFMGIGGSGMAPIAIIAKKFGFEVTGCDSNESSYYGEALKKIGVDIEIGHDVKHLDGVDILAVTPAVFDINPNHPEILEAKRRNILMTWQEFMGKYIHKDKYVISVAGTHGKSTTTILMGLTLEAGGLDPVVEAGTIYKPWGSGVRLSDSKYFVCEADEFNSNFLNYHPSIAVINNIEMDHPEFFKDFDEFKNAFKQFIHNIQNSGILVVNEESLGIQEVLMEVKEHIKCKNIKVIGYYINKKFDYPFDIEYRGEVKGYNEDSIKFEVCSPKFHETIELGILGEHNVSNSLGVLSVALELGLDFKAIKEAFKAYKGIGRRCELIDEIRGIKIYDDYGHHPTAIASVLDTFKMSYSGRRIWAVIEPHQISRLKMFFNEFAYALNKADKVIITKTFVGREIHKNIEPVDVNLLINNIDKGKAVYIESFDSIGKMISEEAEDEDIIIVFGAGNSHKLTQIIVERLKGKN